MVGARASLLSEIANNEKRHVIAPRYPFVEVDPEELRRSAKPDVAFLGKLTRECLEKSFPRLDAPAGKMPSVDIGMLDQKNSARPVDDHGACAERRSAREPPIEMQPAADCGLESAAKALQCHRTSFSCSGVRDLSTALRTSANGCFHFRIILI